MTSPLPDSQIRITGLVRTADAIAEEIWRRHREMLGDPVERRRLEAKLQKAITDVDRLIAAHEARVAWRDRTRDAYAWLRFLSSPERLDLHLAALDRGRRAAEEVAPEAAPRTTILLGTTSSVWRSRSKAGLVVIHCHEALIEASEDVWRAMLGIILSRSHPKRRRTVNEFIESTAYLGVTQTLADLCPLDPRLATGRSYDLHEAFDRVNARYFAGRMQKPQLRWSKAVNRSTFGSYQASQDLVIISKILDDPRVPVFVLEFILYHELLHKKHGAVRKDDRRAVHTKAFRADEKNFAEFTAAEAILASLGGGRASLA